MRIAALATILLFLPAVAMAMPSAVATAKVYVYDTPDIAVTISSSDSGLICSWTITDRDIGDTFSSIAVWSREGRPVSELTASVNSCVAGKPCASPIFAPAKENEEWKCTVTVKDSYGATATGESYYTILPLGFFGSILKSITTWACSWIKFC